MKRARFRIHDLSPYPPVQIAPETCARPDSGLYDIVAAQRAVIRRQQGTITALQCQLEEQRLRAEYAAARADGLEAQHERLLIAFARGEVGDSLPGPANGARRPLLQRLLRRNHS